MEDISMWLWWYGLFGIIPLILMGLGILDWVSCAADHNM